MLGFQFVNIIFIDIIHFSYALADVNHGTIIAFTKNTPEKLCENRLNSRPSVPPARRTEAGWKAHLLTPRPSQYFLS